ncbi:MAG: tetratricopeptide repeat protein, partial [Saprospiraceae bacterium]|nr:tetratricopeptide repeat protein [Saprospiraceae bacterium]
MVCIDSAIELMIAVAGKKHPAYSRAIEVKATMLTDSRKFEEAEVLLQEALLVLRSIPDTNTTQFARLLYSYARLKKNGNVPESLKYYERSQRLFELLNAVTHPTYSRIFDDLGFVLYNAGQYEAAADAMAKSKEIQETQQSTNKPAYLVTLVNLGALNYALNKRDKALTYFEEAAQQYEVQNQTSQANYAVVLNNLGYMYTEMGNHEKSKQTYFRSKTLLENSKMQESPEYAQLLLNIGSSHFALKEYDQAEAAFLESKSTYEKAGHDKAILYFRAWRNIAVVKHAQGLYTEAIPVFEDVLKGWSEAVGELDNFYLESMNRLVDALYKAGNYQAAGKYIESCTALEKRLLNRAGAYFSQPEMMNYLPSISLSDHWFGPLLKIQGLEQHSLCEAYYDAQLFRKGYFLESSLIAQNLIAAAPESIRQRFTEWKKCQEKLSELYALPIAERLLNVDSLEVVGIDLEKELLHALPGFAEARLEVRWQDVMHALPSGAAAIEFVDYTDYPVDGKSERVFAALVLIPNATTPRFVSLCNASDLEKLTLRSKSWLSDYTDKLYSYKQPKGLLSMYDLIWDRLEPALQGASTIYYSPSGLLHRLNPEAIQRKDGSRLADHFSFIKIGSTRQLVIRDNHKPKMLANTAAVIGGIQYDLQSTSLENMNPYQTQTSSTDDSRGFGFNDADSTLRRNDWKYLD